MMITPYSLVYPAAALVALTVSIMAIMLMFRIEAVHSRKVSTSFYRLMRGGKEPERLAAIARNYQNLYEVPILFYTACVLIIVMNRVDVDFVYLAWAFVGLRVLHSLIHITYNHVLHRLTAFGTSVAVLVVMWTKLALGS